jgi:peptidyl-tRNA hydrolase, PTH1 family
MANVCGLIDGRLSRVTVVMKVIVGLGNPGRQYVGTRHNVGFELIDALAVRLGLAGPGQFAGIARGRFDGLAMDGQYGSSGGVEKVLLLEPTTFMNDSGRSVQAALAFYRLTPADLLIVLDDVALPSGRIRLRASGSSGGHNGLRDIERMLATDQYPRLRIGIDAPPPNVPQREYVLGRIGETQRAAIGMAIGRAVDAVLTWIERGINVAMSQFNAADDRPDANEKAPADGA